MSSHRTLASGLVPLGAVLVTATLLALNGKWGPAAFLVLLVLVAVTIVWLAQRVANR